MDLELTRKGRKLIEKNCREAFEDFDLNKMYRLAADIEIRESYANELLSKLYRHCSLDFPWFTSSEFIVDDRMNKLQVLLFYESCDDNIIGDKPRIIASECYKLLETYLVNEGLID